MNHKIVKVTKTEYQTDDGNIHPIMFELDEIPTIEEFQVIYDDWIKVFQDKNLLELNESKIN